MHYGQCGALETFPFCCCFRKDTIYAIRVIWFFFSFRKASMLIVGFWPFHSFVYVFAFRASDSPHSEATPLVLCTMYRMIITLSSRTKRPILLFFLCFVFCLFPPKLSLKWVLIYFDVFQKTRGCTTTGQHNGKISISVCTFNSQCRIYRAETPSGQFRFFFFLVLTWNDWVALQQKKKKHDNLSTRPCLTLWRHPSPCPRQLCGWVSTLRRKRKEEK